MYSVVMEASVQNTVHEVIVIMHAVVFTNAGQTVFIA